jgi:hypothetical protein
MKMFKVHIERRDVYVYTDKNTQTINICTTANKRGVYEYKIRLCIKELFISLEMINVESIDEFVKWLMTDRKGTMEINLCNAAIELSCVDGKTVVAVLEKLPRVVYVQPSSGDNKWIKNAKEITECCIDALVKEFVKDPYMHRVEHSMHTRLYEILHSRPPFDQTFPLLGEMLSQHIHKEWPESEPRPGKKGRRGNFDMAILYPGQICACKPEYFSKGLLKPAVAIEIGLNYGLDHLLGDDEKLRNSKIEHGYLVHLVRLSDRVKDQVVKDRVDRAGIVIHGLKSKTPPNKIAFALVRGKKKYIKLLNDPEIREL